MAYKLKLKEPLQEGVRRIATEQLDRVLGAEAHDTGRVVWVHETRKVVKRLRALLRTVRGGLHAAEWRRENDELRDIGRLLSPIRDRDVMRELLAGFDSGGDARTAKAVAWLETSLGPRPKAVADTDAEGDATVKKAIELLRRARDRMAALELTGKTADVAALGVAETMRKAGKVLARAADSGKDEDLHELRKAVQLYWRQMVLLDAAWPEAQAVRAQAARDLSQRLGSVQDFAVLAAAAAAAVTDAASRKHADRMIATCAERQEALKASALAEVGRLFALSPGAAGEEMATCWKASVRLREKAAVERRRAQAGTQGDATSSGRRRTPRPAGAGRAGNKR